MDWLANSVDEDGVDRNLKDMSLTVVHKKFTRD